ncbi:MAG: fadD4 1 [Acidimicrobiales bacterium]|nr:fadD4 1 [Acidimicrobiales bacterium]
MTTPWDQRLGVWYIAEDHPDLPAIVESPTGETLTFAELAGRAHQVANALVSAGIEYGEIVTMAFPNGVDMVVWQLACQEVGLRYVMLNPALSAAEVRTIADHSAAAGIVIHVDYADRATQLDSSEAARVRVSVGGPVAGFVPALDFLDGASSEPPAERRIGGTMIYTSGTTSKPKGIWRALPEGDPSEFADQSKLFAHAFRFLPLEGVHLVSAGMYHGGCQGFYLGALNVGQALAIMGRFDPERALALIDQHQVTTAYMVPTQFVRFLRLPDEVKQQYDVSSLQTVVHSAAPCPKDVKVQMLDWWGPVIWETYGGTEGAATIAKPERWLEKPGTVGRAVRGVRVSIIDDAGNELGPDEIGQIYIETRAAPRFEYLDDAEATNEVYRGNAFTIGDIGYLDEDGYLFISDRKKDMIITGGTNVYPAEVEGALTLHPAVNDVAVIGVPDDEWGESVKAVVQLRPGYEPGDELANELMDYCKSRLAHFKCPRSVDFRAELPRTDAGKLYKRKIRDEYWAASGRVV